MDLFDHMGMKIGALLFLTPRETTGFLTSEVVFIDLRPEYETSGKRIRVSNIVYIPWQEFENEYHILEKDRYFLLIDEVGIHSKETALFMQANGFYHVACIAGGIVDWERDGLPMNIDTSELLTGSCACTLKPKKKFSN